MNALFSKIELLDKWPDYILMERPTAALLDHAEQVLNFRFPRSYREFALHFGPGELGEWYKFWTPTESDDSKNSFLNQQQRMLRDRTSRDEQDQEVHNTDLVYFCSDYAGDAYAWNPHEVTDAAQHEYKIYGWPRSELGLRIAVAETFEELIRGFFDKSFRSKMLWLPSEEPVPWVYERWPSDCPHNQALYEADLKRRSGK